MLVLPSGHRNGPPACRSLNAAGHRVVAAREPGDLAGRTRHAHVRLAFPPPRHDRDAFGRWLEETCRREGVDVILPLDEELMRELTDRAPHGVVVAGPSAEQYRLLCDKSVLGETARRAGIDHPASVEVTPDGPDGPWPALPSIVKPVRSEPGSRGGRITAVETAEERDAAVAALVAATGAALAQERLDGATLRVDFARAGESVAAVMGRTGRRYPSVTGSSATSGYEPVPAPLLRAVLRLLAVAGYEGTGQVQFLASGERVVVHDVNLRPPMSVAGTMHAGLDLPLHAVAIARGARHVAPVKVRPAQYVWLYAEGRQLLAGLRGRGGDVPAREHARGLVAAAVSARGVLDPGPADPLPWLAALARIVAPRRRRAAARHRRATTARPLPEAP